LNINIIGDNYGTNREFGGTNRENYGTNKENYGTNKENYGTDKELNIVHGTNRVGEAGQIRSFTEKSSLFVP